MIYIGNIVNTHGIKGEIRIKSDINNKDVIFKVGNNIYVDNVKYVIQSYRVHKGYDMFTFKGFNNINDILFLKGKKSFINDSEFDSIVFSDNLVGYSIFTDKKIGTVKEIIKGVQDIIVTDNNSMIPYVDYFIKEIDNNKKIIYINEIEGLLNED